MFFQEGSRRQVGRQLAVQDRLTYCKLGFDYHVGGFTTLMWSLHVSSNPGVVRVVPLLALLSATVFCFRPHVGSPVRARSGDAQDIPQLQARHLHYGLLRALRGVGDAGRAIPESEAERLR